MTSNFFRGTFSPFFLALLLFCGVKSQVLAAKLNTTDWQIWNYSGVYASQLGAAQPPVPNGVTVVAVQGTPQQLGNLLGNESAGSQPPTLPDMSITNLVDNNLSTFVTLSNPPVILIDMQQPCAVDRVLLEGSANLLNLCSNQWFNYLANQTTPPLGLINVYVGNTPTNSNLAGSWTVPYDAGNPVETEADIRFSPAYGRYVRIALQTQVTWGATNWPGPGISTTGLAPATNVAWNVGEIELYGCTGTNAQVVKDAVVVENNAPGSLALAAGDLSYYLTELEGQPVPIISTSATNNYPGTLYVVNDLKPLAPTYATMMANIASGILPTNISVKASGREVLFNSWPYRAVLWGVWGFLEQQGIRWVYPDAHGDSVPYGQGVNLSILPYNYNPPTYSIYANFDLNSLEPWPMWQLQSMRQDFLYPWRNHWTSSESGDGALGGGEIPSMPAPNVTVNTNYTEGFVGYPGNFISVLPNRLLESGRAPYTNWWGWATTNASSAVNPVNNGNENNPCWMFDNPGCIAWVAAKMTNIAAAQPVPCNYPLNICHIHSYYGLLPNDDSSYSQDPYTISSNGPVVPNSVAWVDIYPNSYSGAYFSFVTAVARQVQQMGSGALVGALAYADVVLPPTNMPGLAVFPTNVEVEVCLYGAPNLAMTAPANAGMKAALDGWHGACSHLANYDYALLHTDYYQQNPAMPVACVAGFLAHAQYLATVGALDGGSQGNLTSLPYNPWNFYAYPRVRWNTNQTASAIEQEFFKGYFGEAAAPMLGYYQAMENYQFSNNVNMHYQGYAFGITPGSFPIGLMATMDTNLLAAEQLATNWWVARRVSYMAAGFNYLLTNSPDNLGGINLTNLPQYTTVGATLNSPMTVGLSSLMAPASGIGNNASWSSANLDWFLGSPGEVEQIYNFTAGTYTLTITATGTASGGTWPNMVVYLGPASATLNINSAAKTTYTCNLTIPAGVADLVLSNPNDHPGYLNMYSVQLTRIQ